MKGVVIVLGIVAFAGGLLVRNGTVDQVPTRQTSSEVADANKQHVLQAYSKLPLSFEANQGQTDSEVNFLSHGSEMPPAISFAPSANPSAGALVRTRGRFCRVGDRNS